MEDRENRSQLRCGIKLRFSAGKVISGQSQSTNWVGEGWSKGVLLWRQKLGVRILGCGFLVSGDGRIARKLHRNNEDRYFRRGIRQDEPED